MKVPNFENIQVVDKNGFLTNEWRQIMTELFTQMHTSLSDEGLIAPSQSTSNITQLSVAEKNGATFYDSDLHAQKVIINGIVKTFTVT